MKKLMVVYAAVAMLMICNLSQAGIVYDNITGQTISGNAYGNQEGGFWADDVTLSAGNVKLTSLEWVFNTKFNPGNSFVVTAKIFADNNGLPGQLLGSAQKTINPTGSWASQTIALQDIYSASNKIWVAVVGPDSSHIAMIACTTDGDFSVGSTTKDLALYSNSSWSAFTSDYGWQAYKLEGTVVPEPATMLLLGAGGMALLRRRK